MSSNKNDLESVDFDSDWEYSCQHINKSIDDIINLSSSSCVLKDKHQWSSISLPHIVDMTTQSYYNILNPYNWWYRKKFNSISSDIQSEQGIDLIFESSNEQHKSNINVFIWINGTQIFSDSLSQQKPIELTNYLFSFNETSTKKKHRNTLIICCENTSLSLHARLIINNPIILTSGKMKISKNINEDNKQLNEEKDPNIVNYTVHLNDTDGRIGVVFQNSKENSKSSLSSSLSSVTESPIDEKQIEEKIEYLQDISIPRLAIVILIVGTRGDVQPFIALGQSLLAAGHRVRLATHEPFRSFVRGNGLEFYPLAGNPADLMSFMVKNAGIIPSISSIVAGDVSKSRHTLADILASTWLACIADDDETFLPFTAEAIIANPPSFGHIHCAEKLQIPLHIMFTMPWSPTISFPHPLCNIDSSKGPSEKINLYSYHVVDMLTWSGMHNIVNDFRKKILGLSSLHTREAINVMTDERIPHTYCWSTALASKPSDWGSHINVSGFFFLDLGIAYTNPAEDLLAFLGINNDYHDKEKFSPPIYIGFGSITGHDSRRILEVILDALKKTGYRALLSGLATDDDHLPENIFKIGNVPHDWLFQYVSAVCHHGGAGTTAAGLRAGKPTIIVPFFGDQFFWGNIIEKSGAGPRPLPGKSLNALELAEAFRFAHQPATRIAAENIRVSMSKENGCEAAVRAFHAHLSLSRMRSNLESTFAACYRIDGLNIQISRPVAHVLVSAGLIDIAQLRSHHIRQWKINHNRYIRTLTHTVSDHIRRATTSSLDDTDQDRLTRTASISTNNLITNEQDDREKIVNTFEREKIGYLSSYGKQNNANDGVLPLYDPYSGTNSHRQSDVNHSQSHMKTSQRSLWHNTKITLTTFLKGSRRAHQHDHLRNNTANALIATTNDAIKPAVGTFPTTTWLGRPTFDIVKEAVINSNTNDIHSQPQTSSSISTDNQDEKPSNNISQPAKIASIVSGLSPQVCQEILLQFNQIKNEEKHTENSSSSSKNPSKQKFQFRRQRSHSTSAII